MANQEHLNIVRQGIKRWNQWRNENRTVDPDLSGADLSRLYLTDVHEENVGLNRIKVSMVGADLSGTDLKGAKLGHAVLMDANFTSADLSGADFEMASLVWADLSQAELEDANFAGSIIGHTRFADVDLSRVKGLTTIQHSAPSTIGIDTVYRSHGKIPLEFLRGAGVPDNFITYMHSLSYIGFEFYSCFISYSSQDQEFASRLHVDLQSNGVRCWFAPEDLQIGDPFRQRIDEAIRLHDKLLIVLSGNSVNSPWVEKEVETAFEEERQQNRIALFPIRLDDAVMETNKAWAADIRRTRHIGDFRLWKNHDPYKKAFDRLLRDLRSQPKVASAAQKE